VSTAERAKPRTGLKTISKLLRPQRSAFGDTSYYAVINHLIFRQCLIIVDKPPRIENYIPQKEQSNSQMKQRILILLVLSLLLTLPAASAGCVQITETLMEFQEEDAVFTLKYDIDPLAKMYLMAFGSAKIVPEIEAQFESFDKDDITIKRLDYEQAVVIVKNVSHYNKGYYFHNPHKFGITINKLVVDPPDKSPKIYLNTNITPKLYYKDGPELNNTLPDHNSLLADF